MFFALLVHMHTIRHHLAFQAQQLFRGLSLSCCISQRSCPALFSLAMMRTTPQKKRKAARVSTTEDVDAVGADILFQDSACIQGI